MAEFSYKARTSGGEEVSGTLTADNETDALGELKKKNLVVLELDKGKQKKEKKSSFDFSFGGGGGSRRAKVTRQDIIIFTRQLSTMLSAGIPLLECLDILAEQVDNQGFRTVLGDVVDDIRGGTDFSEALSEHRNVFTDIYINMIRAGEASGQLDEILVRLAEYQEASEKLRSEIKSAMTYPVVSIALILGITGFLLVFIIPKFQNIFQSLGVDLPLPTRILLAISDFLANKYYVWGPGMIAAGFGLYMWIQTEPGRKQFDWLKLKLPVFGPLFRKVSISRFARTFSTLIESGVPILGALEIVAATSGNVHIETAVLDASESVRQGETLATPLSKSPVFPPMVTRMIAIGERSGALETLLKKISEFYDQQVSTTVEQLTSLIEPIMIGIMGLMVGGMVLAVFLPIFKLTANLN